MPRKMMMTYAEVARSFERISGKKANKTIVGRFAKNIGYHVRKPMVNGRVLFFYVKQGLSKQKQLEDGTKDKCKNNGAFD